MNQKEIQKELINLSDEKYKKFHSGICPGIDNIIGVRIPVLRNYAKELYKNEDWKDYLKIKPRYYEEKMLQGMLIGLDVKEDIQTIQKYTEQFVPKIDNWAVCDTFVAGLKITKKYTIEMWNFIQKYLKSNKEFELRFAIVMLLDYYITEEYIDEVIKKLDKIKHEGYYVKMAVAWALSICYIKYPKKTFNYLLHNDLDQFTHNKTIQKIRESYRVNKEDKEKLKKLIKGY